METIHILIAEDNPGDVRLIRMAVAEVTDWPTKVSVARDGEQAIAMLESWASGHAESHIHASAPAANHDPSMSRSFLKTQEGGAPQQAMARPDLVILDFNLPKRSGVEVLRSIRRSDSLRRMPVVVLSSSPEYFLREKMNDANLQATCYITKPPDFEEFVNLGTHIRRCYEEGLKV